MLIKIILLSIYRPSETLLTAFLNNNIFQVLFFVEKLQIKINFTVRDKIRASRLVSTRRDK